MHPVTHTPSAQALIVRALTIVSTNIYPAKQNDAGRVVSDMSADPTDITPANGEESLHHLGHIKTIGVHHLVPRRHEVRNKLLLRVS